MPETLTPMETRLLDLAQGSIPVNLDQTTLAVGSDSQWSTSLSDGVGSLLTIGPHGYLIPKTLSWHLQTRGGLEALANEKTPPSAAAASSSSSATKPTGASAGNTSPAAASSSSSAAAAGSPTSASNAPPDPNAPVVENAVDQAFLQFNRQWIQTELANMDSLAHPQCYVFHPGMVRMLKTAARGTNSVSRDDFWAQVSDDKRRYTAMEVYEILSAGYTEIYRNPNLSSGAHVILRKPSLQAPQADTATGSTATWRSSRLQGQTSSALPPRSPTQSTGSSSGPTSSSSSSSSSGPNRTAGTTSQRPAGYKPLKLLPRSKQ